MRARDILGRFQAKINDLDPSVKDNLKQRIIAIQADAGQLDQLQDQIDAERHKADGLEMDYRNAQARADGLREEYETSQKDGAPRFKSILQRAQSLCGQLGGDSDASGGCTFTCDADNMAPCQNKVASGNQQLASFKSQLQAILNDLASKKQQADVAQAKADSKQRDLETAKDEFTQEESNLAKRKADFEQEANVIEHDLDLAHISPLKPGPALQDLWNVHEDPNKKCYDTGCGPAPAPAAFSVPEAVAGLPAYQAATTKLDDAVKNAESVREKLRSAEKNGASPQELQQLVKEDAKAQQDIVTIRFKIRAMLDLSPVPPKQAPP
jgi:DNA repair exonuclease SbcCD ATPase subunit